MLQAGDSVVLLALLCVIIFLIKEKFLAQAKDDLKAVGGVLVAEENPRDILLEIKNAGKNCVVFYGSQTGTAESYATRIAREGSTRFGLKAMTADLADYDLENLDQFPSDTIVFFVMATYGEGEPTDNAAQFWALLNSDPPNFSQSSFEAPLKSLNFAAFGLGNRTYQQYNQIIRDLNKKLESLGAQRIGTVGEGDDGAGTMEEDFVAWKEMMWKEVAQLMGLSERQAVYQPTFHIDEKPVLLPGTDSVYLGEPNISYLKGQKSGPYGPQNPFMAQILEMRELFTSANRNCLHFEIDISHSGLTYNTGDHLAIVPSNPGLEVTRFLKTFGLTSKRDLVFGIRSVDETTKPPFPTPSTYDACLRYYLEICAPVSRQSLLSLAEFAPNDAAKKKLRELGMEVEIFKDKVASQCLNIAQVCQSVCPDVWLTVPFSCLIELLPKLRPRYYSISSSSLVQPNRVSITAVVDSIKPPQSQHVLKGVTTNYLLALKERQDGVKNGPAQSLDYALDGPRNMHHGLGLSVYVRTSKFRLPSDPSKPILMVGPGTGIAPFRGFVQERAAQKADGVRVGRMMLFYGCRSRSEDWIYREDWKASKEILGEDLQIHNAFSREQKEKVYVQTLMEQNGKLVNQILEHHGAFYICGDAGTMARAVHATLVRIISRERALKTEEAEEILSAMRKTALYQEDVW